MNAPLLNVKNSIFLFLIFIFYRREEWEIYLSDKSEKGYISRYRNGVTTDVKKKSESGLLIKKKFANYRGACICT